MTSTNLMTDEQLAEELKRRNAAVVHFSHHAKTRADGVFPDDLLNAIANRDSWPLSCSVLYPGHKMVPVGSVGVLFDPKVANIISVDNQDSGSSFGHDEIERSQGQPLDEASLHRSFALAEGCKYNEWRVQGAAVKGIFVLDPDNISVKQLQALDVPNTDLVVEDIGAISIHLADVFSAFDGQKVFTLDDNGLRELPPVQ